MERSQAGAAEEVAAGELVLVGHRNQFHDTWGDQFHGAGDQAWMSSRQGFPLIGIDADAIETFMGGDFLQSAIAGQTTSAEDNIGTLVDSLLGGCRTPFRIDERL